MFIRCCITVFLVLLTAMAAFGGQGPDQHGLPFDGSDTWRSGVGVLTLSADKQSGLLQGQIQVKTSGPVYYQWGECEAWVSWNYTYTGTQSCLATATVDYTLDPPNLGASGSPDTSSSGALVEVGVRVTDVASGQATEIVLESRDEIQNIVSPLLSGGYRYVPQGFRFEPGKAYRIEVFLHLACSAYSEVNAATRMVSVGNEADAHASGKVTVRSIRLLNISLPWVRVSMRKPNSPLQDTYNLYE